MAISNRSVISNLKFIYKKEGDHLKGKLKYFQHRDDRDTHIQQQDEHGNAIRRWADRGLGDTYHTIAQNCERLATRDLKNNVGARTLVLSPQVEFMAAIPPDMRMAVMAELTDATMERWFEEMRLPQAEYAFVVHKGEAKTDRPAGIEQPNKEFIHSHVVIAATTPGFAQDRENYKVYQEQLDALHRVSVEEMEQIWIRELGVERVQELNQELDALTAELKRIDLEKSQNIQPEQERSPHEMDETMLEIYEAAGLAPPEDLLKRVYDERLEQALQSDPIQELRDLGFAIPEDDWNVIQDLEDLGFDFSGETEIPDNRDVVEVARELGFVIPEDETPHVDQDETDILQSLRDLGFDIPQDDQPSLDEMDAILEDMRQLGFDIPIEPEIEGAPDVQAEIPDLDID